MTELKLYTIAEGEEEEMRAIYITREQRNLFARLAEQHSQKIHGKLLQIIVDAWDNSESA